MRPHPVGKPKLPVPKNHTKVYPTSKLHLKSDEITLEFYMRHCLWVRTYKYSDLMVDRTLNEMINYLREAGYAESAINKIIGRIFGKIKLGVECYRILRHF